MTGWKNKRDWGGGGGRVGFRLQNDWDKGRQCGGKRKIVLSDKPNLSLNCKLKPDNRILYIGIQKGLGRQITNIQQNKRSYTETFWEKND